MAALRKLAPLADRVLVKRIVPELKSVGGIILPETQAKKNEGEVVAVGPGALLKDGSRAPISVEVGAKVLLPEYGGTKVDLGADGDDEFVLYRDDDILGTFER
ncbi:CPN10 [Symbiodinium sp. KB8]|nr:CPN10 [Symbiodinium sp. KB8]